MVPPCSNRISRVPSYSRIFCVSTHTGLSPTLVCLSRQFWFFTKDHWPSPRSLATTNGVSVDVLSSGYLDVSVPQVAFIHLCIQCMISRSSIGMGCPIRISTDHRLLATSPKLIAGCYVLHRRFVPRHSPFALYVGLTTRMNIEIHACITYLICGYPN